MAGRGLVQQPVGNPLPGSTALVHYDIPGDQTWHTRILLAHVVAGEWVIVTPDGDLYIEDFGPNNPDIDAWRHYDPAVGPPFGIDPAHIYAFHPMPDHVTLQRLIAEGACMQLTKDCVVVLESELLEPQWEVQLPAVVELVQEMGPWFLPMVVQVPQFQHKEQGAMSICLWSIS